MKRSHVANRIGLCIGVPLFGLVFFLFSGREWDIPEQGGSVSADVLNKATPTLARSSQEDLQTSSKVISVDRNSQPNLHEESHEKPLASVNAGGNALSDFEETRIIGAYLEPDSQQFVVSSTKRKFGEEMDPNIWEATNNSLTVIGQYKDPAVWVEKDRGDLRTFGDYAEPYSSGVP